jgi:hypothetical protein
MSFFMVFIHIKYENFVISTFINIPCFVVHQTFFCEVLYSLLTAELKPEIFSWF